MLTVTYDSKMSDTDHSESYYENTSHKLTINPLLLFLSTIMKWLMM